MQNLFGFISHPMEVGLAWLATTVGSAGIGIILFTICVRLLLAPLQIVQLRSSRAMQRISPLIKELQQKHGKDKVALQKATMELYREHRVNPAMGCLPMVLQIPILIGLFYGLLHLGQSPTGYPHAIDWAKSACNGHTVHNWTQWFSACYQMSGIHNTQHVFNLFHDRFLWLSNGLGEHDPTYILPVLAGLTQWVQSRMMLQRSNDPQQQMMNTLMNFTPLMIVFFSTRYASGLPLYWVTSTLIAIAIQYPITGLGLLTELPFGTSKTTAPAPRSASKGSGGSGHRPKASDGNGNGKAPTADRMTDATDMPEAGINGTAAEGESPTSGTDGQKGNAERRPRRKANRAKGGRSGGRRG